jgi:putative transposase
MLPTRRCLVTTRTAFRRPVFARCGLVTEVTGQLLQQAALFEFAVPAYCVMPDHLHALVEATSQRASLEAFVTRFKTATRQALWQAGYHARQLRDGEATDTVARYILENPVRAGLTKAIGEYPYAWSDVYDLESLFSHQSSVISPQSSVDNLFSAPTDD